MHAEDASLKSACRQKEFPSFQNSGRLKASGPCSNYAVGQWRFRNFPCDRPNFNCLASPEFTPNCGQFHARGVIRTCSSRLLILANLVEIVPELTNFQGLISE